MTVFCQPPDPNPRPPRVACPPGAADCHVHVYGPLQRYPTSPAHALSAIGVPDALPAAARHLYQVLGIQRAVLVQPSKYALDNQRQLDAMAEIGVSARAVVGVAPNVSDEELKRLHQAGARGARFAIGHDKARPLGDILRLAERLAPLGWHIDLHVRRPSGGPVLARDETLLRRFPVPLVFAHFADLPAKDGTAQTDFQFLCELISGGNGWVKLSAPYRLSAEPPYRDLAPFAQGFAAARPDRLLWASDWPHVNVKGKMPNTTEVLDCLAEWIPDPALRRRILVDNPQALYRFGES
jgi:predicted TIM-barrel fold metal-dependent hydrolase